MAITAIPEIAAIERQAREAAHNFIDVNDACPYSFYTPAGQAFKRAFTKERGAMLMQAARDSQEAAK